MAETLVPLMVVAPKNHALLPSETATALLPGGGVLEPLDGSLLQPAITMVTDMIAVMIAIFIKLDVVQRSGSLARRRWPPQCKQNATAESSVARGLALGLW